jgi:chromosome segregation ATPase
MTPEQLFVIQILLLFVQFGGAFSLFFLSMRKNKSEIKVNLSQEKNNLADAAETAASALIEALKFAESERKLFEQRIDELEARKGERDKQIADLQAQTKDLLDSIAADTKLTEELRVRIAEMEEKYNRMKRVNEKLVKALNEAGVPMPDFNGDISDSVRGLRWPAK